MTTVTDKIRVDIVSDVVCPWCVIGYRQLVAAAEATGTALDVHWHPFELNPHMADEGENLRDHLAMKYGTTPNASQRARERLSQIGSDLGITFNYTDDMRMVNTFRAHQLIDWAEEQGRAHDTKMALFSAFFTESKDVSNIDVLAAIAGALGLSSDAAHDVLSSGARADKVRAHQAEWLDRHIYAVPAMLFDQSKLVTGAQGEAKYADVLKHMRAAQAV